MLDLPLSEPPPLVDRQIFEAVRVHGADAPPEARASILIEVPHGADRRAHHDAVARELQGPLPDDLFAFTAVNSDVGAWEVGREVAARIVADEPRRAALLLRSLCPRTLVDCNRVSHATDELATGGLTASIPVYIEDPEDRRLLLALHTRYAEQAALAYEEVCGGGGFALQVHTYAPVTVGIDRVDHDIVTRLRAAYEPERYGTWPKRPEIDLITRTGDGRCWAPAGAEEALTAAWETAGFEVGCNQTYTVHTATLGYTWATRYPGRILCFEVRRDKVVREWRPFEEMEIDRDAARRVAEPLATVVRGWLQSAG